MSRGREAYAWPMSYGRVRVLLIVLLALAAAASVLGNRMGSGWLDALAFTCFAVAALLIGRMRRRSR